MDVQDEGFDHVRFAVEQFTLARRATENGEVDPDLRIRLGMLATNIAIAQHLSMASADAQSSERDRVTTTPADFKFVKSMVEETTPQGIQLLEILVRAGGEVSAAQLREITGKSTPRAMVTAVRKGFDNARWEAERHHRPMPDYPLEYEADSDESRLEFSRIRLKPGMLPVFTQALLERKSS